MTPKTKIIATLGPSSNDTATLRKMIFAGLDVVRLNFSHGSTNEHLNRTHMVRALNKKYRRHIRILQDLEGFRIRVGRLEKPLELKKRKRVFIVKEGSGRGVDTFTLDYEGDLSSFKKCSHVFIDDGNIVLKIIRASSIKIECLVEVGGLLKERKGINIPGAKLDFLSLSDKDKQDLEFGINNNVDYIAQSFVRNKKDIRVINDIVKSRSPYCRIIAKIENKEGINNIDEIIDESDGIMIARGDMGVSVPIYEVTIIQKEIIKKCNKQKKFVITATQMLESMTEHLRPTRAEVSDITNAIIDGTDFVMLSAETATGKYPAQSVDMMNKIIKFTEKSLKNK
jgi:pyruvate kinase